MGLPPGVHVDVHPPTGDAALGARPPATVVLVHGSLDRGDSFGRTRRRLGDLRVVTYDRRGYARSRGGGTTGLAGHAEDLLAIAGDVAQGDPVCAVGHSFGGDVVLAAALARPDAFAAVGAYEPPMPWLGIHRPGPRPAPPGPEVDPGLEAEEFFTRMVGPGSWAHLTEAQRSERRADGPALVEDMRAFRGAVPFDVTELADPLVVGRGGRSRPHHREVVAWLVERIPGTRLVEIDGAGHGAHLSHPDHFAAFVEAVVVAGSRTALAEGRP
ncbi:MAG TPA: alpha/beta hydrolase [Acidimicrobiales bacterium]|nr:alpha/beta hydrolase [Acidimicrobiales bacterium]